MALAALLGAPTGPETPLEPPISDLGRRCEATRRGRGAPETPVSQKQASPGGTLGACRG